MGEVPPVLHETVSQRASESLAAVSGLEHVTLPPDGETRSSATEESQRGFA